MNARGCPTDRAELLSLLAEHPAEDLLRHVRDCPECTRELAELRAAQSLIPLHHEEVPSQRVRARVMALAERAVATGRDLPWVRSSRGRATIVAAVAAFTAVGLGQMRGAFPTVSNSTVGAAALLLAVLWAIALAEFARPMRWVEKRPLIETSLAAVGIFSLTALMIPIPVAARYCAEMMLGGLPSRPVEIAGLYLVTAALCGVASTGAARFLVGNVVPGAFFAGPLLFTILTGPTVYLQVAAGPVLVMAATFCGLLCGATVGWLVMGFSASPESS